MYHHEEITRVQESTNRAYTQYAIPIARLSDAEQVGERKKYPEERRGYEDQ